MHVSAPDDLSNAWEVQFQTAAISDIFEELSYYLEVSFQWHFTDSIWCYVNKWIRKRDRSKKNMAVELVIDANKKADIEEEMCGPLWERLCALEGWWEFRVDKGEQVN